MNQIFSTICAIFLLTASSWAWPCSWSCWGRTTCYVPEEQCIPKPCKKAQCCHDAYRDPYRIIYPDCRFQPREYVEIGNTPGALAIRRAAVVRQKELACFERSILAATDPISQPTAGTTLYGGTEGAGVVDNPCAPIPYAPAIANGYARVAPVGEEVMVTAKPVPGKPGYVYCPFLCGTKYISVIGLEPGCVAKDPFTGRLFRVP